MSRKDDDLKENIGHSSCVSSFCLTQRYEYTCMRHKILEIVQVCDTIIRLHYTETHHHSE